MFHLTMHVEEKPLNGEQRHDEQNIILEKPLNAKKEHEEENIIPEHDQTHIDGIGNEDIVPRIPKELIRVYERKR